MTVDADKVQWNKWHAVVLWQIDASSLIAASVMAAPCALAISKLSYPETEESPFKSEKNIKVDTGWVNLALRLFFSSVRRSNFSHFLKTPQRWREHSGGSQQWSFCFNRPCCEHRSKFNSLSRHPRFHKSSVELARRHGGVSISHISGMIQLW